MIYCDLFFIGTESHFRLGLFKIVTQMNVIPITLCIIVEVGVDCPVDTSDLNSVVTVDTEGEDSHNILITGLVIRKTVTILGTLVVRVCKRCYATHRSKVVMTKDKFISST